jgi:flavorubredoxin
MKARKIKEGIYWVGAIDWDVRNFHGYLTQRGTSYNCYLIIDEKITLIDTVKATLENEMIKRISDVVDPSKINYVISNHVEMDHSGTLPKVMELAPKAMVFTSPNGEKGLKAHYRKSWNYKVVKTGDSLSIGKRNLHFVLTPMVHWPDNMVSYMPEEKILFSNDAFGQHIASSERFDDEYPLDIILEEAKKYYANIVLPYSNQVQKALTEAGKLDIEIIANSHGLIWKKYIKEIIEEYKKWSLNTTVKKAIIIYDTMWKSTEIISYALREVFEEKGYKTYMGNLQHKHVSDIMTELIDAEYICIGSPTLNRNVMPSVAGFLTYMNGLAPKNRKAVAFGSYGWGGESIRFIKNWLEDSGSEVIDDIKIKYIPGEEDLKVLKENLKKKIN